MVNKTSPRRRLSRNDRRAQLLEAADALIRGRGTAVRVEDVVARAAVAKGTFYTCFESWDDLLAQIRAREMAMFLTQLGPIAPENAAAWKALLPGLAEKFVEFIIGLEGLHEVLFHSEFATNRPLLPEEKPGARIAAILRAGQAAGAYAELDPEPVGALLFSMIHETADSIVAGADRARSLATLRQMITRAVHKGDV